MKSQKNVVSCTFNRSFLNKTNVAIFAVKNGGLKLFLEIFKTWLKINGLVDKNVFDNNNYFVEISECIFKNSLFLLLLQLLLLSFQISPYNTLVDEKLLNRPIKTIIQKQQHFASNSL